MSRINPSAPHLPQICHPRSPWILKSMKSKWLGFFPWLLYHSCMLVQEQHLECKQLKKIKNRSSKSLQDHWSDSKFNSSISSWFPRWITSKRTRMISLTKKNAPRGINPWPNLRPDWSLWSGIVSHGSAIRGHKLITDWSLGVQLPRIRHRTSPRILAFETIMLAMRMYGWFGSRAMIPWKWSRPTVGER